MKDLLLVCLLMVAFSFGEETYDTSRYKNIDIDKILGNERLLNNYFNCLMGVGNCTPDGEELKRILPDAIKTGCAKCTEEQLKVVHKIVVRLRQDHANIWKQLTEHYDPNGIYRRKYKNDLKRAGFSD